jgi:shikimate dehydrogenase
MQNAGLAALGLDCRYLAFDVPPERLGAAVAGARSMRFVGLNLTVPHKQRAVGIGGGAGRQRGALGSG